LVFGCRGRNNSGSASAEFHELSSAASLYRNTVSLKSVAVVTGFNEMEGLEFIGEKKIS
jgi:hypothetical protein